MTEQRNSSLNYSGWTKLEAATACCNGHRANTMYKIHSLNQPVLVLLVFALLIFISNVSFIVCGFVPLPAARAADGDVPVNVLLQQAYIEMLNGHFDKALSMQIKAVKLDKNNLSARRYLGYTLLKMGAPVAAAEQLKLVVKGLEPSAVDMCILGEAYYEVGKLDLAQLCFEHALTIDPDFACANVGLQKVTKAQEAYLERCRVEELLEKQNSNNADSTLNMGASITQNGYMLVNSTVRRHTHQGNNQSCNSWENYKGVRKR